MAALEHGHSFANRFEIERQAGSGGMGAVYRARDLYTGQIVALKIVSTDRGTSDGHERFAREARLLSELTHPGIVSYVAYGHTPDGKQFLAMEWLDGEDLGDRLERGPLPLGDAVRLVQLVAEALEVAHRRGVVHRDLKPTNLFLVGGEIARVKVLDFGVARRSGRSQAMTRTGLVVGTPDYMAPEQARGEREITPAVDIFSLGCVLYECLTGQPPFVAEHVAAVLTRILFEDPPPVELRRPGTPEPITALVRRMLAKQPAQRFADASALRVALAALHDLPEVPLAPTVTAGLTPTTASGPDSEQSIFSIVIASLPDVPTSETVVAAEALSDSDRRSNVMSALATMGVQADFLADGSLVVTAPETGSATDQAARAARAALAVKERWPAADVALATGRGSLRGFRTVGEVVDRAAGLLAREAVAAQLAPPGEERAAATWGVRVDELSARLLEPRFTLVRSADSVILTGEEKDADATRPLLGKPTPCVGRDAELIGLESALASCLENGEPRAVLITAPAGLGKSRVRHEFVRRLESREEELSILFGRGDPMSAGLSYGVLGQALRRLSGILDFESLDARRAKLAQRIAEPLPEAERAHAVAFVSELCGAPLPDTDNVKLRAARQDPLVMSDQITQATLDFLRAEADRRPVVLVLEDLHWADALSVRLIEAVLRRLTSSPILVLGFARPEIDEMFPRLWSGAAQVLPLRPMSKKAGERLVRQVLGDKISAATIERIVEQSAGNALFLEELIREVAEGRGDETPATVLAMLQARLGRLDAGARRVLRAASIFGESASLGGIRAVLGAHAGQDTEAWLGRLVQDEILEVRPQSRFPGEQDYRFRNSLTREAVYGLWVENDRAASHLLAGEYLESRGETDPLVLAEHFWSAGAAARAIRYFLQAAEQSYDTNDMTATLASAERGIACGAQGEELGALLGLQAVAYFGREEYAEVVGQAMEAIALVPPGGRRWCRIFQALFPSAILGQQPVPLPDLMGRFASVDPSPDARIEYLRAVVWLVAVLGVTGMKPLARTFFARAKQVTALLGEEDVLARAYASAAEASDTHVIEEAPWSNARAGETSMAAYRMIGDRRPEIMATTFYGKALMELGDVAGAEAALRENLATAERVGEAAPLSYARTYLARLLAATAPLDRLDEPARLAEEAIASRNVSIIGVALAVFAEIARRKGDLTSAAAQASAACAAVAPFPGNAWDVLALRLRILLELGHAAEAAAIGEEAVQQLERLDLSGAGEIALRVALAEARHASGQVEAASAMIAETIPRLRRRVLDIPDVARPGGRPGAPSVARARYLEAVPANARLVSLAKAWLGDDAVAPAKLGLDT